MSQFDKIDMNKVPQHVAIIMDGNGRWAKEKGLERTEGHMKGIDSVREIIEAASKIGVKYITIYAFSTENWARPKKEVETLMDLMVQAIIHETDNLLSNDVKLEFIGDIYRLPIKTREALLRCVERTANGKRITLVLALSYSSRWELTEAAKLIATDVKNGVLDEKNITETTMSSYLATKKFPDPDLLVRTGGEVRISNFLLWQVAYSELYFTDVFWPDFGQENFYEAILNFQKKERRFGKTSEQLEE